MTNAELARKLKSDLEAVTTEAKEARKAFNTARDEAVTEHGLEKVTSEKSIFDPLNELNRTLSAKEEQAEEIKSRLMNVLEWDGGSDDGSNGSGDLGAGGKAFSTPDGAIPLFGGPSAADRVFESDAYKALKSSGVLEREKSRVDMDPIELLNRDEVKAILSGVGFKDIIAGGSTTSAGAFIRPERLPGLTQLLFQEPVVLGLITLGQTNSDAVEYVKQTAFTNSAAETAEASGTSGGVTGGDVAGTKPESNMTFAVVKEFVRTIAHWIPITKRALADEGQVRTIIESQMEDGVRRRLETQVISGNGVGENLKGILNQSGIGSVALSGGEPSVETLLKAITTVRLAFLEPNAVVLHPNDFQQIRLLKETTGGYIMGPPNLPGPAQLWGKPIALTTGITENTGLVGKMDEAVLWTREGISLAASDSHMDFFVRNLVAILAEGRWAFGVPRPAAFCKATGI